jgi:hypothetical protein
LEYAGVDEQAVDFSIEPLSPFTISGRIVSPLASISSDRYRCFLVRQYDRVPDGDGLVPDMDGDIERFEFRNVPRGSYDLFVAFRKVLTAADTFLIGRTSVNVVDGDVGDLIVTSEWMRSPRRQPCDRRSGAILHRARFDRVHTRCTPFRRHPVPPRSLCSRT